MTLNIYLLGYVFYLSSFDFSSLISMLPVMMKIRELYFRMDDIIYQDFCASQVLEYASAIMMIELLLIIFYLEASEQVERVRSKSRGTRPKTQRT